MCVHKAKIQIKYKLAGEDVFKLSDTYGFPVELTRDILAEDNIEIEENDFKDNVDVQIGIGIDRCFARYGTIGKRYYYKHNDEEGKQRAIKKANAQEPNIKRFILNYWVMKND